MAKLRYSGNSGHFQTSTVKELKEYAKMIGIKNRSKLKTRYQLIQAIEKVIDSKDNIVYYSLKRVK